MAIRYSTQGAASMINAPNSMLSGTYDGTFHLEYPDATDFTSNGKPCGAFGLPRAILKSNAMSSSGMTNWQNLFSSGSMSASIWIDVWNPRTGALTVASGILHRPKFSRMVGYGSSARYYEGVEIVVSNIDYLG